MPLRYRSRRAPMTRRSRLTRRRRIYRRRRLAPIRRQRVHYFKRQYNTTLTLTSGADTATTYTYRLSDCPNYTEWTALYDQYKISAVKTTFTPRFTETSQANQCNVHMWSVIDRTDATNLTSAGVANEYTTCVQKPITKYHSRYFKPACQILMNTTQGSEPADWIGLPKISQWLPTSAPDIKHYALKTFAIATGAGSNITLDVSIVYYVACRSVK